MTIESPKFGGKTESEKEARIKDVERQVNEITDKLGAPIDPEIKEAVVSFNLWEFPTNQSCEGHIEKKEGGEQEPYSWVEIYAPEPEGWEKDEAKQKEWIIENQRQQEIMQEMLGEFYQGKEFSPDIKLSFEPIGIYGAFRIRSAGAETMKLLSKKEQKKKLEFYRKEMNAFAKFLKDKFLGE